MYLGERRHGHPRLCNLQDQLLETQVTRSVNGDKRSTFDCNQIEQLFSFRQNGSVHSDSIITRVISFNPFPYNRDAIMKEDPDKPRKMRNKSQEGEEESPAASPVTDVS